MDELTELQKVLIKQLLAYGYHGDDIDHPFVIEAVDKLVETFKRGE